MDAATAAAVRLANGTAVQVNWLDFTQHLSPLVYPISFIQRHTANTPWKMGCILSPIGLAFGIY